MAGVSWVAAFLLFSFALASFIASTVVGLLALQAIFAKDSAGLGPKDVSIAQALAASMALFALGLATGGAWIPIALLSAVIAMMLVYLAARMARSVDGRFSTGLLFWSIFPLGFLLIGTLARVHARRNG